MTRGLSFAMKSARAATPNKTKIRANTARWFLPNCRQTAATGVSGRSFLIRDPRIGERIQEIREQNAEQGQQRAESEDGHDERIVASQDSFVTEETHTRYRKQSFDHNAAADERGQDISH